MNRIESGFFKLAGINPESEGVKWYSIAAFAIFSKADWALHNPIYQGDLLPETGPALVVFNHRNAWDIARGYVIGERSHRLIRTFAKHTLLDPTAKESQEVLERARHKSDLLNSDSGSNRWKHGIQNIIAPFIKGLATVIKGAEAIPVVRGGSTQDARKSLNQATVEFHKGHIVGIFGQESRQKDGKLISPMLGAEVLAMESPDIPIYAVAMARSRVSVRRLGSFNQLCENPQTSQLAETNLTVLIFDSIADQSDPEIAEDWYQIQRPALLPPSLSG